MISIPRPEETMGLKVSLKCKIKRLRFIAAGWGRDVPDQQAGRGGAVEQAEAGGGRLFVKLGG